jgi:hypothetical protein
MNLLRCVLVSIVTLIMTMPVFSFRTSADGGMFTHADVYDQWGLAKEDTQYGLIGYHDGYQRMVISIRIGVAGLAQMDKAVWLFPVPSNPRNATIDMVGEFREIEGKRMSVIAQDSLTNDAMLVSATQFYPLLFWIPIVMTSGTGSYTMGKDGSDDVQVTQTVVKYGMTTELVGTNSSDGLTAYLQSKGLDLPSTTAPVVDEYIGKDYSFVASWISNVSDFRTHAPMGYAHGTSFYNLGVMIGFPTERIFYPLRLTSVYGSTPVPMVVQVVGFVDPVESSGSFHGKGMKTDYLKASYISVNSTVGDIFYPDIGTFSRNYVNVWNLKYTEIIINTTSDSFTNDLWIDPSPPLKARALDFTTEHSWAVSVPILILTSVLASLVSGLVVFRGFRPRGMMFALLGLCNILTIVGVFIAARRFEADGRLVRDGPYPWDHAVASYLVAFTVLFMTFAIVGFGLFIGLLAF